MSVRFEKYHGTGNDFLVVDADAPVPDRSAFAAAHCDRETGVAGPGDRVGADGVLFLDLDAAADPPRVDMTLVQPDGGTASMCGNGARCAAAWAAERTGVDRVVDRVIVDPPAGAREARIHADGEVTVGMGVPRFGPEDVPADADEPLVDAPVAGTRVTAVDTGVPHAVAFVDDVDAVDLASVAPPIRHADVFPEGANVTVAAPDGDGAFRQRTFERGVEGETRSCGTGAVAVAAAAKRLGRLSGASATVRPPGGTLAVSVPDDGPATLRGPVVAEFEGELAAAPATDSPPPADPGAEGDR